MTEDMPVSPTEDALEAIGAAEDTMNRFLLSADVGAVYGEPIQHGENLIIPAAEILSWAGFGVGYGGSGEVQNPAGGGGGGGGHVFSRPVAVIVMSPDRVRVKPVVDATKIALAAFTALGFMVATYLRMRRGKP